MDDDKTLRRKAIIESARQTCERLDPERRVQEQRLAEIVGYFRAGVEPPPPPPRPRPMAGTVTQREGSGALRSWRKARQLAERLERHVRLRQDRQAAKSLAAKVTVAAAEGQPDNDLLLEIAQASATFADAILGRVERLEQDHVVPLQKLVSDLTVSLAKREAEIAKLQSEVLKLGIIADHGDRGRALLDTPSPTMSMSSVN
jgi:hypothetical protein